MKTVYYTATSLDGFIADKSNSLEWLFQFDESEVGAEDFVNSVGAIAMGSTTYDWVLDNHVFKTPDKPQDWVYKQPTWVFSSRSLRQLPEADIRFVQGDVSRVHQEMRDIAGEKPIWIVGGGELAGQFFDHGLLDEMVITITSVTLGGGAPLFPRRVSHPPLELLSVQYQGSGFAELRYRVPKL